MEFFMLAQFLLFSHILCVFAQINYVIPNNHSLPPMCKSEVCLTVDEYAEQTQVYFVPGATFEFLAGNHTLQHAIIVNDTLNLTLMGDPLSAKDSSDIYISSQEAFFRFHRAQNLTFKKLSFFVAEVKTLSDSVIGFESSTVSILDIRLEGGASEHIPTMKASRSAIQIAGSTFWKSVRSVGEVFSAFASDTIVSGCYFSRKRGLSTFGVIYIQFGSLSIESTTFEKNSALFKGVIACDHCTLNITGNVNFTKNNARAYEGVLSLNHATVIISGPVFFYDNIGGAVVLCATDFQHLSNPKHLQFVRNKAATGFGGAMVYRKRRNCNGKGRTKLSAYFINNTAGECGGAVFVTGGVNDIKFHNAYFEGNQGSALCFFDTHVIFSGVTRLIRNMGEQGGGLYSERSSILFMGPKSILYSNNASTGGAIHSVYGNITFSVNTLFQANKASTEGGALYALGTAILLSNVTRFIRNSAVKGGAMYFEQSTVTFNIYSRTNTSHNYAYKYGGVIFNKDTASRTQCNNDLRESALLSYCFISFNLIYPGLQEVQIYSYNDSAGKTGMFLFGGLLDRCQTRTTYNPYVSILVEVLWIAELQKHGMQYYRVPQVQRDAKKIITSKPYQLCVCSRFSLDYNCSSEKAISIYRGQKLTLSLLALDQTRNLVSTTVKMSKSSTARLLPNQDPQLLQQGCSTLTYNIHSTNMYEEVVLYPDGPCHDTGFAAVVVKVTLLTCPNGFIEDGDHCVCEERLQEYADCFINDSVYIVRKPNTRFWMGAQWNDTATYIGLILYNTCPADYCTEDKNVQLTLDDLDIQCEQKRSGVLCGACATNYSLMLGSSKCEVCSDWYLFFLPLFAGAGIILVIFLSVLRLTIASGFLNSIILYANIVQANRSIFIEDGARNILTVFVAWLNLDLGFQVCFYNGMDAYAQTWLQFAFPIYVWVLVCLIILISRYSITVSKLIGHNPIAVLATVILMSYTKILKIIVEVFSSVELEYPDNKKVVVWLKDANVPYLHSKHLVLTVVIVLVLVFFFLPFTGLLLVGHKLYQFSGKRWIHLVLKSLKPFLDSYHAPYRNHTRYWTGFLLLVRCALYIVFSYNSLGGTRKSLLAINIVFTALLIITWLSVYRRPLVTFVEGFIFFNLVVLATATLAGLASSVVVHLLVGVVFVTMLSIVVYHFHIAYIVKTEMWTKLVTCMRDIVRKFQGNKKEDHTEINDAGRTAASQSYPLTEPSKTVVDLREPLLEK